MNALAVLALCVAVVGAWPMEQNNEGAWWQQPQARQEAGSDSPSAYVSLSGNVRFSKSREESEDSRRPQPEMGRSESRGQPEMGRSEPRPQWLRPQPEPMRPGVNMNMSPEEFYSYQMFKKMMEEKRQKEEEEKKQNEEFAKLEEVMGKYDEAKHQLLFSVTVTFVKFCQCSEIATDVDMMFAPGGNGTMNSRPVANTTMPMGGETNEQDHVTQFLNLVYKKTELTPQVVSKLSQMKMSDMKKLAFGGLVKSVCHQIKSYVTNVKTLKANFLEMAKLQGMGGMS